MSPKAVTVRIVRTAQLRRLCLMLRPAEKRITGGRPRPRDRVVPTR